MNTATKRRKRRRAKLLLRFGKSAVRKHMRKTGRTGQIVEKRTHGKSTGYVHVYPNPVVLIASLGGKLF